MTFIDRFERSTLFRFTRLLALIFIGLMMTAMLIGTIVLVLMHPGSTATPVHPEEVISALTPQPRQPEKSVPADVVPDPNDEPEVLLPGLKVPFALQKHISNPELLSALKGWLLKIPAEDRQQFLDGLGQTVDLAESQKLDPIKAIDTYHEIYMEHLNEFHSRKLMAQSYGIYIAGAFVSAVFLIALLSLILVLLAIERNTRTTGTVHP